MEILTSSDYELSGNLPYVPKYRAFASKLYYAMHFVREETNLMVS